MDPASMFIHVHSLSSDAARSVCSTSGAVAVAIGRAFNFPTVVVICNAIEDGEIIRIFDFAVVDIGEHNNQIFRNVSAIFVHVLIHGAMIFRIGPDLEIGEVFRQLYKAADFIAVDDFPAHVIAEKFIFLSLYHNRADSVEIEVSIFEEDNSIPHAGFHYICVLNASLDIIAEELATGAYAFTSEDRSFRHI